MIYKKKLPSCRKSEVLYPMTSTSQFSSTNVHKNKLTCIEQGGTLRYT